MGCDKVKFELLKVQEKDKNVIYNLMQIYTYELSFYEDENTDFVLLDTGLYKMSKYIDMYWQDDNRHPYILKCDGKLCGFALYRKDELNINEIAERNIKWFTDVVKWKLGLDNPSRVYKDFTYAFPLVRVILMYDLTEDIENAWLLLSKMR